MACTWILPAESLKKHSPGLIQTVIGAAVSEALGCFVKWPNDLMSEDGRKLGGVLVEGSSADDGIRVGIGLNREVGVVDRVPVVGWNEFVGEKTIFEVFEILDAAISSLFEEHPLAPPVERDELIILSWKSLSRSLSTGVGIRLDGTPQRAVGLNGEGHLLAESRGRVGKIDDLAGLDWGPIP
jgi:biotin-(acetyl-CoA carboxylase) ligase